MKKRFFQVGFNRCGTTAIADMFERNALTAVHHTYVRNGEVKNLAIEIAENIEAGLPPLAGMDHIDAFTDVEYVAADRIVEGYKYFRAISEAYPEVYFILNVRKREDWILSRLNFGTYLDRYAAYLGTDRDGVLAHWESDWDAHIAAVKGHIPDERLLVWDIDAPDFDAISAFLDFDSQASFRKRNKSVKGPLARFAHRTIPECFLRPVPNRIKNFLKDF